MNSLWSRPRALAETNVRRVVVTGSLIAAVAAVFAVLAGAGYAASHVTPSAVARSTETAPPTPAGDQYGKPSGYKSKCTLKASAAYASAITKARKTLTAQLKLATTKSAKALAVKKYDAAVVVAKAKYKTAVGAC